MESQLLATKLFVPQPRPGLVARPRLIERLNEALGSGLVMVSAPAGFGKHSPHQSQLRGLLRLTRRWVISSRGRALESWPKCLSRPGGR
jgi:ATP/maltotriose-dependent transcriptional regulator MalT